MKYISDNNAFITQDDEATWLVTYADLMTLLLVFFVLLYTLAYFEKEEYKASVEAVKVQIKENKDLESIIKFMDIPDTQDQKISIEDITGLRSRQATLFKTINQFVKNTGLDNNIDTQVHGSKIIIRVSGEALFNSGSVVLNPLAVPVFDRMSKIFSDFSDYDINIKGHTDDIPISTRQFPSNWELSAIRATTVLKYLVSKGIKPQRLTATGYGDIMPRVPNTADDNRASNRRVEFVLEKKQRQN